MRKHVWRRSGQAYRRLLLSFALIFLIPIGMSFLFYIYAYRTVRAQAKEANSSLLGTIKSTCDRELEFYENMLTQLALNNSVQALSSVKGDFTPQNSFDLYTLHNALTSMGVSANNNGGFCRDMFVYFKNSDRVVSTYGSMDFDLYCRLYAGDDAAMKQELKQTLTTYHFRDVRKM